MSAIACPGEGLGTANLLMLFVPLEGWRHVEMTDRHTAVDYAHLLNAVSNTWITNEPKIGFASKSPRQA